MYPLTAKEKEDFVCAVMCHICKKPIRPQFKKVRDHCHLTGKYRGAAHEYCNLIYQDCSVIPVVFHNLSGYDAHFIIRDVATQFNGKVKVLALNKEKYISFTKYVENTRIKFRFIDSFRFLASSLEKLASYLTEYKCINAEFFDIEREKIELLTRKGVFPYEYLDKKERLSETQLPAKKHFYSTLNDSTISDDDYRHAQNVWSAFECQTLGDYVKLYLKTDVLLLADVFEGFREQCCSVYDLDPANYYTTPGLTWDAMLKYTNIRLELFTDVDMLLMIEQGKRGGVSQCSNRYSAANNKYMTAYNESEESVYIVYLDENNLYGWAMGQPLPHGEFEWVSNVDDSFDFNIPDDAPFGYILEVDLDYPQELHDEHNDLPFCPEHASPLGSNQAKLLTTLSPKQKYVLHYRTLKQALANGLVLRRIYRVIKFSQSTWLKSYIDYNTNLRANAKNDFEKNLFKLMNNAVYGKTMENVRKYVNVKLVTKWEGRYGAEALIAKPNFHSRAIFSENLVAIELRRLEVLFNKPIYIGLTVLDVSKILMYEFHYDYVRKKYGDKCKLLYTDTDSFIYELKCVDVYEDMKNDIQKFDTSDYPVNNVYGMPQANKKVLGLMKDECSGKIITEFVGLRSKMYSIRINGVDGVKKAKGVKSNIVKKTITFDDYKECLRENIKQTRTQHLIRSRLHNVETIRQTKLALSSYDDKRFLLSNSTDTLALGHFRIREVEENDMEE
ncbi:uncharacterized protein LOC127289543 [Leptopilina boulardi]|uniref:uncharacterized protein LOC127289543 n=1 Tax=Leptopilina boulardi TaxID=63433 RepID=UPI0021F5F722|nr:uncharacterized protein LOC127289543 [Leptopilina boulardi]